MTAKPPKGIETKLPTNPLEAELLWHILQEVPEFRGVEHGNWHIWAFGLLGGIDIAQSSSLLKDRPIRLEIHTHRASIQQFCKTLQMGYHEVTINNQTTADDIDHYLSVAPNLYYRTRQSVRKIFWDSDKKVWWMQDWLGRQWYADEFSPKRGERLILMEEITSSFSEVLHLVLSEQAAHFLNATGVQEQMTTWQHHLRRPSLRKSWPSIVQDPCNYFWAALQIHHEIVTERDIAFRELYIQFILLSSERLESDAMRRQALLFRRSIQHWQRLSTLFLEDSSEALSMIPELDWGDFSSVSQIASDFINEESVDKIELRLQVFDTSLKKIVDIERMFFTSIVDVLSNRVRGHFFNA